MEKLNERLYSAYYGQPLIKAHLVDGIMGKDNTPIFRRRYRPSIPRVIEKLAGLTRMEVLRWIMTDPHLTNPPNGEKFEETAAEIRKWDASGPQTECMSHLCLKQALYDWAFRTGPWGTVPLDPEEDPDAWVPRYDLTEAAVALYETVVRRKGAAFVTELFNECYPGYFHYWLVFDTGEAAKIIISESGRVC